MALLPQALIFKVIVFRTKSTDKNYRCMCEALYDPGLEVAHSTFYSMQLARISHITSPN